MSFLGVTGFLVLSALCVGMFYMAYLPAIEDSLERDERARDARRGS